VKENSEAVGGGKVAVEVSNTCRSKTMQRQTRNDNVDIEAFVQISKGRDTQE
jgi:hypothetical protein